MRTLLTVIMLLLVGCSESNDGSYTSTEYQVYGTEFMSTNKRVLTVLDLGSRSVVLDGIYNIPEYVRLLTEDGVDSTPSLTFDGTKVQIYTGITEMYEIVVITDKNASKAKLEMNTLYRLAVRLYDTNGVKPVYIDCSVYTSLDEISRFVSDYLKEGSISLFLMNSHELVGLKQGVELMTYSYPDKDRRLTVTYCDVKEKMLKIVEVNKTKEVNDE